MKVQLAAFVFILFGSVPAVAQLFGSPGEEIENPCPGVAYHYRYQNDGVPGSETAPQIWTVEGADSHTVSANGTVHTISWSGSGTIRVKILAYNIDDLFQINIKTPGSLYPSVTYACPNVSFTINHYGWNGAKFLWEKSPAGANTWTPVLTNVNGGQTANQSITTDTDFRVTLTTTNSDCTTPLVYGKTTVRVYGAVTPGSIAGETSICIGSTPPLIWNSGMPTGGDIHYKWRRKVVGSTPESTQWEIIAGATAYDYQVPDAMYYSTDFQRIVTSCVGPDAYSNIIRITVDPASYMPPLSGYSTALCEGQLFNPTAIYPTGTVSWYYQYKEGAGNYSTLQSFTQPFAPPTTGVNRKYIFQAQAKSGVCPVATVTSSEVTVYSSVGGAASPTSVDDYGFASGDVQVSPSEGTVSGWQYSIDGGTSWFTYIANNTNTTMSYSGVMMNTFFRAVKNNGGCTIFSSPMTVNVHSADLIVSSKDPAISVGNTVTLSVNASFYSYQWFKNSSPISGATAATLVVSEPANYQVQIKTSASAQTRLSNGFRVYDLGAGGAGMNTASTITIRKPGVTSNTNLYNTLQPAEYSQSIAYLDGLTRPVQTIAIAQSPSGKDIVQPRAFNQFSQEPTNYLPYISGENNGLQKANALKGSGGSYSSSEQYQFYQNTDKVAASTAPFAKTVYDNSPLNRILKQGAPGIEWQPNTDDLSLYDKTVKNKNTFNATNEVLMFSYNTDGTISSGSTQPIYYLPGVLFVSTTYDENNNQVIVYADKLGRTILKKVQYDKDGNGKPLFTKTYYIYDDQGRLATVLPPEAVKQMEAIVGQP